jgi:hypothetical protein
MRGSWGKTLIITNFLIYRNTKQAIVGNRCNYQVARNKIRKNLIVLIIVNFKLFYFQICKTKV